MVVTGTAVTEHHTKSAADDGPPAYSARMDRLESLTVILEEEETGSLPALALEAPPPSEPEPAKTTSAIEQLEVLTQRLERTAAG